MAPKIGPRGTKIEDVIDVATNGAQANQMKYVYNPPTTTPPAFNAVDLASLLASQPQPGAGKKYAGYPSLSMMEQAILGSALNFKDLGTYAANQRDILAEPAQTAYNSALDTSNYNSLLSRQLSNNQQIRSRNLAEDPQVMAAQKAIDDYANSQGLGNSQKTTIGYSNGIPTQFNIGSTPTKELAAALANAQYGANMERQNATFGTINFDDTRLRDGSLAVDMKSQLNQNALNQVQPQAEAARQAALKSSGALRADEIAQGIGNLPVSQLAQLMAGSYGLDANTARAMFGPQTDVDYAKALASQNLLDSGVDPSMTEAEMILTYRGPEALVQYQQDKAYAAMYGTPAEQDKAVKDELDAQTAIFDLEVQTTYGVSPKNITNVDPQIARQLFLDTNFTGWLDTGIAELTNADGSRTPEQIIGELGSQYLAAKPAGKVEAIALVDILANWKFLADAGS